MLWQMQFCMRSQLSVFSGSRHIILGFEGSKVKGTELLGACAFPYACREAVDIHLVAQGRDDGDKMEEGKER